MGANVQIPLPLLCQTIDFLEKLDASIFDRQMRSLYDGIYSGFINKLMRVDLRDSYSKIAKAETETDRKHAVSNYLIARSYTK